MSLKLSLPRELDQLILSWVISDGIGTAVNHDLISSVALTSKKWKSILEICLKEKCSKHPLQHVLTLILPRSSWQTKFEYITRSPFYFQNYPCQLTIVDFDNIPHPQTTTPENFYPERSTGTIRTETPFKMKHAHLLGGVQYFEMTVQSISESSRNRCIGIGFVGPDFALSSYIGFNYEDQRMFEMDGDDGNTRLRDKDHGGSEHFGSLLAMRGLPPINKGDTVGAGLDYRLNTPFFTLNGKILPLNEEYATQQTWTFDLSEDWYPAFSYLAVQATAVANVGQRPFKYNLADHIAKVQEIPRWSPQRDS
eukprot:TRINITY_DN11307_c1_g1_i2.p1 TRINITY_DN11307_c1_g1~~TRINITY_DN11307_c1_g1_i2.p1  ORF type:complete len:309 (-),score=17.88 TRINITY_DN11307_c1_g1_i2:80-1006(-)